MRSLLTAGAAALMLALTLAPAGAQASGGGSGLAPSPGTGGTHGSHGARPGAAARSTRAVRELRRGLNRGMRQAGAYSGAYVLDLTTGRTLYAHHANTGRMPASVEKLYTTTTALQRFGPDATLTTSLLGTGQLRGGTYTGTLYLRGGGDPTFGSATFDQAAYGTGATIQQLVADVVHAPGLRALRGRVVADETLFDSDRGTPATGNRRSTEVEGELSALAYDRGWRNRYGTSLVANPALSAGRALIGALRAAGVNVPRRTRVTAAATPPGANVLASVASPTIAQLVALTNTPSDNYFAETLLKDIGAKFGAAGTTAAGAAVVRAQMAQSFGIHPRLDDGSGLSRYDRTTPRQVVMLLRGMASDPDFTNSLAVAGETGTLQDELRGTYAQGRCRGKTGSLHDASNVVGYCRSRDGHTLAFAVLTNGIYPDYAHPIQDRMIVALARYDG
ncbi:MAG: D-alanyl-D-alanine carboxypeptidase/D-alanyl-D-alanine endopeptidase [Solirubrobacteraceae bacterium]